MRVCWQTHFHEPPVTDAKVEIVADTDTMVCCG